MVKQLYEALRTPLPLEGWAVVVILVICFFRFVV
jgi:hypothetical protein